MSWGEHEVAYQDVDPINSIKRFETSYSSSFFEAGVDGLASRKPYCGSFILFTVGYYILGAIVYMATSYLSKL
jgi:hypothetical protein